MKITILAIGKIGLKFIKEGITEYSKRLSSFANINVVELKEEKIGDKQNSAERQRIVEAEGESLLKRLKPTQYVFLLDLHGEMLSSEKLAQKLDNMAIQGESDVVFVIGGAFGVSETLRKRANVRLSFSPMTFTHQMIRMLLLEQIYRAFKINRNEPYHW